MYMDKNTGDIPKFDEAAIENVNKKTEELKVLDKAREFLNYWINGEHNTQDSLGDDSDADNSNTSKDVGNKNFILKQPSENDRLHTEKLINALKVKLAEKKLEAYQLKQKKQTQILRGVWIIIGIQTFFLFIVIAATISCVIFNYDIFKTLHIEEVKQVFSFIKFFTGATLSEFIAILFFITKNVYNDSFNVSNKDLEEALEDYKIISNNEEKRGCNE